MRAAENTEYGAPSVIRITEIERPTIGAKEVLVRVHASPVTEGNRRLRAADFPDISRWFGRLMVGLLRPRHPIGGTSFAGRVVEVGAEVTRFRVGDDVFGNVMHGAYAEYVAVAESESIARMPATTTYAEAAALPYGGGTALTFLRDFAKVQPGERVLVVGASGGVGRSAVQIAKHLGAHVTGVCSRDHEGVRALGADATIDYRHEDFTARGERWDVIFDTTHGAHFRDFRRALTPTGRYLSLYLSLRVLAEMLFTSVRARFADRPRAMVGVAMTTAPILEELRALVEAGALTEPVSARFAFTDIVDAATSQEDDTHFGSVVVDVVPPSQPRVVEAPVAVLH